MKILTTGGHLTPALAFIDFVSKQSTTKVEFVFLGRKLSQVENKQQSQEKIAISEREIKFIQFQSGKLALHPPQRLLWQTWLVLLGLMQAIKILAKEKPNIVVLFGGYLAVPVAIAAWLHNVPIVTHEQTSVASLSNQIISFFSKKIAVSNKISLTHFPKHKTVFTGNLLRSKLEQKHPPTPTWIKKPPKRPILYITGGNQGSQVINTTTAQILAQLTKNWTLIHQCGAATKKTNYRLQLENYRTKLSQAAQRCYYIREWVRETELAWLYKHAQAVISRAGANTIFELQYFGIPAILIPLPFSHKHEQLKNAELAAKSGGVIILPQNHLTPKSLLAALKSLTANLQSRRNKILLHKKSNQGNKKFWRLVESINAKK